MCKNAQFLIYTVNNKFTNNYVRCLEILFMCIPQKHVHFRVFLVGPPLRVRGHIMMFVNRSYVNLKSVVPHHS